MKLIPLYGINGIGKFAQVDDENYDFLMKWRWFGVYQKSSCNFYAICNYKIGKDKYTNKKMHNLILKKVEGLVIDHKDGNGLNNQKSNLRHCTHSENSKNRKKRANTHSQYKGVTKLGKSWSARIRSNGENLYLGSFPFTPEGEKAAAIAYNEAAIKYHGEFASLNNIENPVVNKISLNKKTIKETKIYTGELPPNSKAIYLSKGLFTIVSDCDYEYLNQWKWCAKNSENNYFCAYRNSPRIKGKKRPKGIRMHRFIMQPPKGKEVDHINRNPLDNRRENLRIVTPKVNASNRITTLPNHRLPIQMKLL